MQRPIIVLSVATLVLGACDDSPEVPPEVHQAIEAEKSGPKLDVSHSAVFSGSDSFVVPNLAMVLMVDPGDAAMRTLVLRSQVLPGHAALSLTGSRPIRASDPLAGQRVPVRGSGKTWIGPGDGMRTDQARYQVESATIIIDAVVDDKVSGRVEGVFWRLNRRSPESRPPTETTLKATFKARLTVP